MAVGAKMYEYTSTGRVRRKRESAGALELHLRMKLFFMENNTSRVQSVIDGHRVLFVIYVDLVLGAYLRLLKDAFLHLPF